MVRKVLLSDLKNLFALYKRVSLNKGKLSNPLYRASIQRRGFLLGGDSQEDMRRLIKQSTCFLVFEDIGKIFGFAVASTDKEYHDDKYKIWFQNNLKEVYYHNPHSISFLSLAVDPSKHGKGIGSQLLSKRQEVVKRLGYRHVFCVITMSPITNCPSLVLHEKLGFRRVALGIPRRLFGLGNYSSVLLYKKL